MDEDRGSERLRDQGSRGLGKEPENPFGELLEGLRRTRWRPAKSPWGAADRRRAEMEERREELMKAWRRRRTLPAPDEREDGPA